MRPESILWWGVLCAWFGMDRIAHGAPLGAWQQGILLLCCGLLCDILFRRRPSVVQDDSKEALKVAGWFLAVAAGTLALAVGGPLEIWARCEPADSCSSIVLRVGVHVVCAIAASLALTWRWHGCSRASGLSGA